ncbi:MAG: hypothetical protein AAFV87_11330 [Pseudomonadota bacterium]
MKKSGLAALVLAGCDAPERTPPVSDTPVPADVFTLAQQTAAACAEHLPDWEAVVDELTNGAFLESSDPAMRAAARANGGVVIEAADGDLVVAISGTRARRSGKRETLCFIGAVGMTPDQAFDLAQPWVRRFDLQTNAERGQGLSSDAVQA